MDTKHEEFQPSRLHTIISSATDRLASSVFILPTVLALLFLSIFPLIASLYVSLAKFDIAPGGFKFTFVGLKNYKELFTGSEGTHFLGKFAPSTPLTWIVFGLVVMALAVFWARYLLKDKVSMGGLIGRIFLTLGLGMLSWMLVHTLWNGGRLGTASTTLVYVFVGIFFQYILGLGLDVVVSRLAGSVRVDRAPCPA